jgi:hypothetical protein
VSSETAAAFARRLGVHRSTVCRALQDGRLLADSRGRLEIEQNIARWNASQTGQRPDVAERNAANRSPVTMDSTQAEIASPGLTAQAEQPILPGMESAESAGQDAASARYWSERLMAARNDLLQLRNDLQAGVLYRSDAARKEFATLGGVLRAAIERLPAQLSPNLCRLPREGRADLLRMSVGILLRDLRKREVQGARRLRSTGEG